MKQKQLVDLIVGLVLALYAAVILVLPTFNVTNMRVILLTTFLIYTIVNTIRFIILRETKDFEGLHYAITSLGVMVATLTIKSSTPYTVALLLFSWIALNSLAKLKKADYYHDRRDRMWKFGLLDLSIFLLAGILACINLAYSGDIQIIVLGFFLLVNGILEIFDPILKSLIAHS